MNFPISYGKLSFTPQNFHSISNYLKMQNDDFNQPNGLNSDFCIEEIFENDCKISEKCGKLENEGRKSLGYQQTHK